MAYNNSGKKKPSVLRQWGRAIGRAFGGGNEQPQQMPRFEISEPYNFQHVRHVEIDPRTSTGFSGLPPNMRQVLKASGISREDTNRNPQAVLDVLNFHMEGYAPPPPPRHMPNMAPLPARAPAATAEYMAATSSIRNEDYRNYYHNFKKLGQGAPYIAPI